MAQLAGDFPPRRGDFLSLTSRTRCLSDEVLSYTAPSFRSWPMAVLDPNLPLERNFQFCRKKNFNVCCERHTIRATAGESEDEKKRASLLDILRTSRSSGVRKQSGSRPPSLTPVRKLWLNLHWLTCHLAMLTPELPISFGRSFIFGNPSFIRSVVSS